MTHKDMSKNRKTPPLEGSNSDKMGVIWTFKHDMIDPKLYEILLTTELKGENYLDLNNLYTHAKMSLKAKKELREDILPS